MLEKYYKYKVNYQNYLILIKIGNFYECLGNDALIINKVFNYKLKRVSNTLKLDFQLVVSYLF